MPYKDPIKRKEYHKAYMKDWIKTPVGRKYKNRKAKKWAAKDAVRDRKAQYCRKWNRQNTLKKFGLDEDTAQELLKLQGNCCAMADCRATSPGSYGTWYVDHDHVTGNVRGLLCNKCNTSLGWYEKNKERHTSFDAYLCNPPYGRLSWH